MVLGSEVQTVLKSEAGLVLESEDWWEDLLALESVKVLVMESERMLDDSTAHTLLSLASGEHLSHKVYHSKDKADRWHNHRSLRYKRRHHHHRRRACSHNLGYWCMGSEKV